MMDIPGDVPGVRLVEAHPTNYRPAVRATYDLIIVHVTDGHASVRGTAEMFQQPHHGASAHFAVGSAPLEVIQMVRLRNVAWHCKGRKLADPAPDAVDKYAQNAFINERSIGIEHGARTPGELGPHDLGVGLTQAQLWLSAKLVAYLCRAAGLEVNRDRIMGHCEADPTTTHTDCPNAIWPWDEYMALVKREYARLI